MADEKRERERKESSACGLPSVLSLVLQLSNGSPTRTSQALIMSMSAVRREKPKQEDQKPIVVSFFCFLSLLAEEERDLSERTLFFQPTQQKVQKEKLSLLLSRARTRAVILASFPSQLFVRCVFSLARLKLKGQSETRDRNERERERERSGTIHLPHVDCAPPKERKKKSGRLFKRYRERRLSR